jgi:hypothetical protein
MVTTLVWVVLIGLAPGECEAMEMGAISVINQVLIDISAGQFCGLVAAALMDEDCRFKRSTDSPCPQRE